MLPAIGEPPTATHRRAWGRRWRRQIEAVRRDVDRYQSSTHDRRRVLVNLPTWPGLDYWRSPKPVPERPERLGDGYAFVMVSLPNVDAVPVRHGLTAWLGLLDGVVIDGGIVVEDAQGGSEAAAPVEAWCSRHRLPGVAKRLPWRFDTKTTFSRGPFWRWAYQRWALVVGADLGRTLGLLAQESWPSQSRGSRDGWALGLPGWGRRRPRPDRQTPQWYARSHRPVLRFAQLGQRGLNVTFDPSPPWWNPDTEASEPTGQWNDDGSAYHGRFVELIAAAGTFDGADTDALGDHLDAWGLPRVDPHAVRTDEAGVEHIVDVLNTQYQLAVVVDAEAAAWGTEVRGLVSSGTLAERTYTAMGISAPLAKYKLPRKEFEHWRHASHGGWVTADITGQLPPAADLDIRSAYPVFGHHLGWSEHMTAASVRTRRRTRDARRFFAQNPAEIRAAGKRAETLCEWGCTRLVLSARGASSPVTVVNDHDRSRDHLVVHPVEAERYDCTFWDAIAAVALDGEVRFDVLDAVQVIPVGREDGLSSAPVPGGRIQPETALLDLVRQRDRYKAQPDDDLTARQRATQLREFTNSFVYGNHARFDERPGEDERPGPLCWPPFAASLTAVVRCHVACLEADVRKRGGAVICRDTDGAMVTASPHGDETITLDDGRTVRTLSYNALDELLAEWDGLAVGGRPFWKVQRDTDDAPTEAVSFGSKRYALCQRDGSGRVHVVSSTASNLGYEPPPTMAGRGGDGFPDWCTEVARAHSQRVADGALALGPLAWEADDPADEFPAFERWYPATPDRAATLPEALGARPFTKVVTMPVRFWFGDDDSDDEASDADDARRLVTLDWGGDLSDWRDRPWYEMRSGRRVARRVTTDAGDRSAAVVVQSLGAVARRWANPSSRPPLPECIVVDPLLVRGVGRAAGHFYGDTPQAIFTEVDDAAVLAFCAQHLGRDFVAEATGVPVDTVKKWTRHQPRATTATKALAGLRANGWTLPRLVDAARAAEGDRCAACGERPRRQRSPFCSKCANLYRELCRPRCAWPACTEPVRRRGARCATHQREHDRLRKRRTRGAPVDRPCATEGGCPYGDTVIGRRRFCRRCAADRKMAAERERRDRRDREHGWCKGRHVRAVFPDQADDWYLCEDCLAEERLAKEAAEPESLCEACGKWPTGPFSKLCGTCEWQRNEEAAAATTAEFTRRMARR